MEKSMYVIQGTSNLGKTETLNILIDLFSCISYNYVVEKYDESSNDRHAYFCIGGVKICVCTAGDAEDEANSHIDFIKKFKPHIIFSACHKTSSNARRVLKEFSDNFGYAFIPENKNDNAQESRKLATKYFIKIMSGLDAFKSE